MCVRHQVGGEGRGDEKSLLLELLESIYFTLCTSTYCTPHYKNYTNKNSFEIAVLGMIDIHTYMYSLNLFVTSFKLALYVETCTCSYVLYVWYISRGRYYECIHVGSPVYSCSRC